jgi:hypothetical protein
MISPGLQRADVVVLDPGAAPRAQPRAQGSRSGRPPDPRATNYGLDPLTDRTIKTTIRAGRGGEEILAAPLRIPQGTEDGRLPRYVQYHGSIHIDDNASIHNDARTRLGACQLRHRII